MDIVTIKDIAQRAGVSRGTVDRVLNHRGRVSAEKEELITRLASEMGYHPNIAGKGLAARKKQLKLGFVYPDKKEDLYFQTVVQGAKEYAENLRQFGSEVFFFPWGENGLSNQGGVERLIRENAMDGWVMDGMAAKYAVEPLKAARGGKAPLVVYHMDLENTSDRLAYVGCDYDQAGRLACGLAAMMTDGIAQVGVITRDYGKYPGSRVRIQGFEQEMAENYPDMNIVSQYYLGEDRDQFDIFLEVRKMVEENRQMNVIYLVNPENHSICQAVLKASRDRRIKIITNDLVFEEQRQMIRDGRIAAAICQEPERQGALSLEILFSWLALGTAPEKDWYKTELSILIRQNV